jgi:hypothetical protein
MDFSKQRERKPLREGKPRRDEKTAKGERKPRRERENRVGREKTAKTQRTLRRTFFKGFWENTTSTPLPQRFPESRDGGKVLG